VTSRNASDRTRLSDEQLKELLQLIKGADSVELKLTIPADQQRATIVNLGMDPVEAQPRQVFFFDTPDLALDAAGVVVRARRIAGGKADTVVKLRPVVPDDLSAKLRKDPLFKVEVDAMPGGFVASGSYKGKTTGAAVRDVVSGKLPLSKIFTKGQRKFFKEHAPEGIDLDSLVALGPTFILKGTFQPVELQQRFVAEMWLYQDGSRVFELSTKSLPANAFQVAAESRAHLVSKGIDLSGEQSAKTHSALEFFKNQLAERAKQDGAS
jgi:hypothetical protein